MSRLLSAARLATLVLVVYGLTTSLLWLTGYTPTVERVELHVVHTRTGCEL